MLRCEGCLSFELGELVKVLGGLNGRLQEGALFVAAEGESLQNLVEANLVFLVHFQQELAELEFEVVGLAEVVVAALLVGLEELLGQIAGFESFVDGLGAEAARAHCCRNAAAS